MLMRTREFRVLSSCLYSCDVTEIWTWILNLWWIVPESKILLGVGGNPQNEERLDADVSLRRGSESFLHPGWELGTGQQKDLSRYGKTCASFFRENSRSNTTPGNHDFRACPQGRPEAASQNVLSCVHKVQENDLCAPKSSMKVIKGPRKPPQVSFGPTETRKNTVNTDVREN